MFVLIVSDYVFMCFSKIVMSQRKCFLLCITKSFDCGVFGFQIGSMRSREGSWHHIDTLSRKVTYLSRNVSSCCKQSQLS